VAGDFFWAQKINETVLFAVADATGHGVPAAMVSVVCCNALNDVARESDSVNPAQMLDAVRDKVMETFGSNEVEMTEGMDISLCALNGMQLYWAGANRPLWIIRNGELTELKGDRQPVGAGLTSEPFTLQEFTLLPGDRLYLFSDGFTDQFGGPDNKKFKSAYFKGMLVEIQSNDLSEQQKIISSAFDEWKGDRPQLDDVCVVGVEV
jgi:serine phosphatase RsbU (regulator of sigma subunit)